MHVSEGDCVCRSVYASMSMRVCSVPNPKGLAECPGQCTGACLQVTVTHNRAFLLSLQFSEKNAWTSLRDIRLYLAISILIMQYRL